MSGLNFQQLTVIKGTAFSNFFYKEDNRACSQTLYFLFKVRRACVIKYKPQGIYWLAAQGGKEKKNETTSVYRLRTTSQLGIPKFWKIFRERFLSIQFCPGISIIFGWMVGILENFIQQFLETFLGNFCTVCHCFQILLKFCLNGKHPSIPITKVSVLVRIVC